MKNSTLAKENWNPFFKLKTAFITFIILVFSTGTALADFDTSPAVGDYQMLSSNNWNTAANWRVCATAGTWAGATVAASVPSSTTNVFIPSGVTCTINANSLTCKNLIVTGTLSFNGNTGTNLFTVNGNFTINGTFNQNNNSGWPVDVYGNLIINGTYATTEQNVTNVKITMKGAGGTVIGGTALATDASNKRFGILTIDLNSNTAVVTLQGNLYFDGTNGGNGQLNITRGIFNAGGKQLHWRKYGRITVAANGKIAWLDSDCSYTEANLPSIYFDNPCCGSDFTVTGTIYIKDFLIAAGDNFSFPNNAGSTVRVFGQFQRTATNENMGSGTFVWGPNSNYTGTTTGGTVPNPSTAVATGPAKINGVTNGSYATPAAIQTAISACAAPVITRANNSNGQVGAGNLPANGSAHTVIANFQAGVTGNNATLNTVAFTTTGTATASDITNFQLWFNASSSTGGPGSGATSIKTISGAGAGTQTFGSLTQAISNGTTGYFWITAQIPTTAVYNRTIIVGATPALTFVLGTATGTTTAAGTQSIITVPTMTTGTATSITATGATLGGTVSANGASATVTFNSGTTVSYGTNTTANESPVASQSASVTGTPGGLIPNTLYHFRVNGSNSVGNAAPGNDATFTTLPNAPVSTGGTLAIPTGFTANWTAPTGQGSETFTYTVEVSTASDIVSGTVTAQAGITSGNLSYSFTTLSPGTNYWYRVKAVNAGGTQSSAWSSISGPFSTTSPTAPILSAATVTGVTNTSAVLGATLVSNGGDPVTARGTSYNTSTPVSAADNQLAEGGTATGTFLHSRIGLAPQTLYYFVGYAQNGIGAGISSEGTFRTLSNPPTAQPGSFTATAGVAQVQLDWTSATFPGAGANATGYIILRRQDGSNPTATGVVNATAPGSLVLAGGTTLVTTVNDGATLTYTNTLLSNGQAYNYLVIPFTWDGTNTATYNYLTSAALAANATTPNSPVVTTGTGTSVSTSGITLNGTVSANGLSTAVTFNYGTTTGYGDNVSAIESPVSTQNASVTAPVSGLAANTLYHFRASATNAVGTTNGNDATFTTLSNAPVTGNASNPTSAGFTASWTAPTGQGAAAFTYTVDVSTSNTFVSVTSFPGLSGTSSVLGGLAASTTYYFRVKVVNAGGSSAWSAASAPIITNDADTDGPAPAVGNNIRSIANQYLLRSRQRTRYMQDDGVSNTVNGLAAITLKLDNGGTQPPSGLGPDTKYAWYMVNQGGNNYSLQNVFTQRYIINGGGSPGDGYVGFVGGSCDTRNWNTASLVDAATFNGIANTNKKWFTRSVNATIYYQFASLFGATDVNYAGYYINTDYTGTNNGNNANNVLVSAVSCASTTRDFEFTTYTATPDLEVTGVATNLTGNTAVINTAFTATATIRNNGLLAVTNGTNIKVKFVLGGKIFTTTYSGGLAAGASAVLPAVNVTPATLTAGSPLIVTVNSDWAVAEYNYSNNAFTIPNVMVVQPSMNVSGTLSAVSTVYGSGTPFTSYTISGSSLASNITVTAPAGYQVSQTSGTSGYATSQVLTAVSNTVASTTIYVRIAPTSSVAGSPYSGNVTNATTGIANQTVATVSSSVSPAALTISGITANNKPYDGNTTATLGGSAAYVGLQNGENLSVTGSATADFDNATSGTGKTVTIAGYTAPNSNYTLTAQPSASADITPVALTVTADNKSKNYDGNIYSGGYTYQAAGFVNGENAGVISGTVSYTGAAITATAAGNHTITPDVSSLVATNYTFTPVNGTLTINPASQSFADFRSKTDGSLSNAGIWEYNGGGGTWFNATQKPGAGNNVEILNNITFDEAFTVGAGKTLKVTNGTADFNGQPVTFRSDASGTANLGQVIGTVSNATNVTVERYIPNNGFRSWRLLSVPTYGSGQTIRQAWQEGGANPLPLQNNLPGYGTQISGTGYTAAAQAAGFDTVAALASLLTWTGSAWAAVPATNVAIANQQSYFVFLRGERSKGVTGANDNSSATTLRTHGTIYTGDQVKNVGANAFALIPNLYPSAVNFSGLTRTGGVNNLFYIWDSKKINGNSLGMYQTFSNTNSFNCMISGGSYTLGQPNTTIESGQSFFVTSGAAGTITLKESAKVNNGNSLGFRPAPSIVKSKIDTRLYNSNNEMLDANTVVFDAAYDKAVSEEDAPKMGNPGANFAIETGSKLLAIEGTVPVKENDAIQFRMWNLAAGNYKLELAAANLQIEEGLTATLEDSYLHTSTVLSTTANTAVSFAVNQDAGSSSANRFRIVFSKAKAITVNTKQGYTIAPNPVENGTMNLVFANQPKGKYSVRILGTGGQSLSTATITHAGGNANQSISIPAAVSRGTYTVEIIAPDQSRTVKTVLVNRK